MIVVVIGVSVIAVSVVVDSLTCKFMACTSRDQTRVTSKVRFTNNLRKTKITDTKIHKMVHLVDLLIN